MSRNACFLVVLALLASFAGAQEGERDGGRGERGRGGPGDFLQRMDANGNGMIDPEEAEGRAGFFLRRIAENNPDIDLSKPVPLEKLEQASAAARERWEVNRGGDSGGRDGGRDERRDEGDAPRSSGTASANKTPERLVPGFGEVAESPVVPGFGLMTKALAIIKVTDADRQEAQRRFGYYDRDNNGLLEGDEMEQARSRGYHEFDSNQDGKLTLDELAMRYAKRRVEEEAAAKAAAVASSSTSSSSSSRRDEDRDRRDSGRSSSSSTRSSSSKTTAAKPYRIASADERLAKKGVPNWFLDKDEDGDGQVAMAEYGESWSESTLAEFGKYDLNSDGVITPDECLRAAKLGAKPLASSSSRGGYASSRSSGSSSSSRSSGDRGYGSRTEVAKADPPASTSPASETTKAEASGDETADDDDEEGATASGSSSPAASGTAATGSGTASSTTTAKPPAESSSTKPVVADTVIEVDPRYLSYAQGRIKQVDANGDGMLQPDEWIKMTKSPAAADANGDQRITPNELAIWFQKQ